MILGLVLPGYALTFSGNSAADGWVSLGNSLDPTKVVYAGGSTHGGFSFNGYAIRFTLGASDSANAGLVGSRTGVLADGSAWQVGDEILGIGVSLLGGVATNGVYMKWDFNGSGNWTPATSVGGSGGSSSANAAVSGVKGGVSAWIHPHSHLVPGARRYSNLLGQDFIVAGQGAPTPGAIDFGSALLGWSILDSGNPGSGQGLRSVQSQFLLNYSQLVRLGMPVAPIESDMRLVIGAYGENFSGLGGLGQDAVFGPSSPVALTNLDPVPEPFTLGLGVAAAAVAIKRRKSQRNR